MNTTGPVLMNPENTKDIRKDDKMFREEFKTEDIQSTQQTGANKNIQNQDALKPNNQGKPYVPAPSGTQQPGSEQEDLPSTLYTEKSVTVDDTESLSESVTISTESDRKIKKKQRDGNKLNEAPIVNESSEKNQFQNLTVADSTELYKNIRTEKILQFAQEAYNQNQFQQAISLCNQILLRNDGTEDNALLLKAKCLYKLGDKNSSVQLLQELIKRKSPLSNEAQHIIDSY
ncbi:MAG: tetratricopeptide repeat protein [Bacteroidota bacterium]